MNRFTVKIANRIVAVTSLFESTEDYCKDYLCDEETEITLRITPFDIAFECEQLKKADERAGVTPRKRREEYLETIALQRKLTELFLEYNTVLFHGSVVSVDGYAYMFTAKSGTGKSTHTRLWREMLGERAIMVNDDKPFISVDGGCVLAHGSPWNGKHKIGNNISVPLKAICVLERGEANKINEISVADSLAMLFQQSSHPRQSELMHKYIELLDGVARGVRFYRLSCNMSPEAAVVSYGAMSAE